jgi:hypothetical protein
MFRGGVAPLAATRVEVSYPLPPQMLFAALAALTLGAVMTIGDWTWAVLNLRHTVVKGLIHGAVMCLFLGAAIGIYERRPLAGTIVGPVIGVIAAGVFYLLAPWLRLSAMFPAWMLFWICFALLQARLRDERASARLRSVQPLAASARQAGRGIVAAVLSGAAFYAISGIWTRHDPSGPNYAWNFVAWSFAFLPGFVTLFWTPARR